MTNQTNSIWSGNHIKQIREIIIEFISSLTKSNGISFVRAIAQCWGERKRQQKLSKDAIDEIHVLINVHTNINNYTINDMIYNMYEFIRNPSIINEKVNLLKKKKPIEEYIMILFRKKPSILLGVFDFFLLI